MNIFKKLFNKQPILKSDTQVIQEKNLGNLKQFDDVWVKINNTICEGWVVKKEGNIVDIVYTSPEQRLLDISFTIERPLDRLSIEQNNCVLYLTKEVAGI